MTPTAVRLLSLLSLLQSRRQWSGAELAQRLDVSSRTVRNDIGRLRDLGYAVEGTRGSEGGYRLGTGGAAVPPLLLDPDEATAVAVGLRTGLNCIIGGMEETSLRALAKLEQTLPSRLRARVRNLNRYTVPLPSNHPMPIVDPTLLTMIAGLCASRERLRFRYGTLPAADAHVLARHEVEPYRLVNRQHRWHLLGFDIETDEWGVFDVARIQPRLPSGPRFKARDLPTPDVATFVAEHAAASSWRYRATVTLHRSADAFVNQLASAEGVIEPVDDHRCTLHIGAESQTTIALTLGRLETDFTIIDPPELRAEVRALGERLTRAGRDQGRRPAIDRALAGGRPAQE